tara:strand:+ start:381 stop:764 length:384 start_codon:yes stop_codon:yes gene_type:complete
MVGRQCAMLVIIIYQEKTMLTCVIRYEIDPTQKERFAEYARNWGEAIPRCGADLIGYFAPHEGSSTLAYGIYNIESLAAYEAYRARLSADPLGRRNYEFAQEHKFLLREDRTFLKCMSHPHGKLVQF